MARREDLEVRFGMLQGALESLRPSLERVAVGVDEAVARLERGSVAPATFRDLQVNQYDLVSLASCCAVSRSTSAEHDLAAAARAVEYVALRGGAAVARLRSAGSCRTALVARPQALADLGALAEELQADLKLFGDACRDGSCAPGGVAPPSRRVA
jgi:hypothetical protein